MPVPISNVHAGGRRFLSAAVCLLLGAAGAALSLQTVLGDGQLAQTLVSSGLWRRIVAALGGATSVVDGYPLAEVEFTPLLLGTLAVALTAWTAGAGFIAYRTGRPYSQALAQWGRRGWAWWLIPGGWEILRVAAFLFDSPAWQEWLISTPHFWFALTLAGWLATLFTLARRPGPFETPDEPVAALSIKTVPAGVWLAAGIYFAVFTAMNWQLYHGLWIPHGDSAMYEEHLWNLTHGKGFRSYLDQGLFLGEHVQVIHLLLIPLHLIWPSHLLLELCESLVLASGAVPVYWLTRRHTGSKRTATLLACAYLLYFPLQYLDIAIDLKTFRPIALGMPLVLFAVDQLERARFRTAAVLLLFALSAKEDFSIIIAPLGLWIAWQARHLASGGSSTSNTAAPTRGEVRRVRLLGAGTAVFGAVYLVLATRVIIPFFRGGEEVHYARYFRKFGDSLTEIVWTMLTDPRLLLGELLTFNTALYALAMLLPLGFVPLLSPGRLLVAAPLFGILCLNEIAQDPRHHFHAPLVPIVFWAAAAGLGNVKQVWNRLASRYGWKGEAATAQTFASHFTWTSAWAAGLFLSLGPLGIAFWDADSLVYWKKLYVPGKRAEMFPRVFEQIPQTARVASTDFVHPRFTHHERSYDYSHYPRKVSGYELTVPPDTDYIVIDTQHPYSEIKSPEQVREYREHPETWELLPDVTEGYFIVLKRRREVASDE